MPGWNAPTSACPKSFRSKPELLKVDFAAVYARTATSKLINASSAAQRFDPADFLRIRAARLGPLHGAMTSPDAVPVHAIVESRSKATTHRLVAWWELKVIAAHSQGDGYSHAT
jgi:hypothetical protein